MKQETPTNYELLYGTPEKAAEALTLDIQKAMIEKVPYVCRVSDALSKEQTDAALDAVLFWQVKLYAATTEAIKTWAIEFLSAHALGGDNSV